MNAQELRSGRRRTAVQRLATGGIGGLRGPEALAFVSTQSAALERALQDPSRLAAQVAIDLHEASHECWLSLLATLTEQGREASDAVALYTYSGRVAWVLERCARGALPFAECADIRRILRQRLRTLTGAVAEQFSAAEPFARVG